MLLTEAAWCDLLACRQSALLNMKPHRERAMLDALAPYRQHRPTAIGGTGLQWRAFGPLRTRVRTHSRGLRAPLRVVRVRGRVRREGHEERARDGAAVGMGVTEGSVGVRQRAQAPAEGCARGRRNAGHLR